jgi:FtsP/CotA-like multicopper oxidase with cupredoxin domain
MINTLGIGSTDAVLRFRVARKAADDSSIPERLSTIEPLRPGPDAPVREWRFIQGRDGGRTHWRINGLDFDPGRMDASPRLGEVELWRFYSDLHHPVHVHLDPFQVVSRGNRGPGPYDSGWKDTIDLRPWETAEVAVRFTEHAGRYVLHCHNLEHEDMMMMAAFETVR